MPDPTPIQQAAQFFFDERQAGNHFRPIPASYAPRSLDDAYAVQAILQSLLSDRLGPVAGYKIALTTPVMQQMVGVNEPVAGTILANTIHHSPTSVRSADFGRLGVECEIAVHLHADLPAAQAPYNRESVAAAIGAVQAAFELIDDRHADYTTIATDILSLLADNAWNAGIVLGPAVTDWRAIDLSAARGTMRINGDVVGQGEGRDVMGHPLAALAWLANTLARRDKSLERGMIVMTGSVVATKFVQPGDRVELTVDGLGEISLQVT